jgi:hypothetical protein
MKYDDTNGTGMGRSTATILGMIPNGLAPHEKARLFAGLESFVNAGDGLEDYHALAVQCPTFWPHNAGALDWLPKAHAMFLDYRDKLRKIWSGDPEAQGSGVLAYLLGLIGPIEFAGMEYTIDVDMIWFARERKASLDAYKSLLQSHPERVWTSHSMVFPVWGQTNFHYFPRGDFETAMWVLFGDSWRARICGQCKRYFIADKPAQGYCSTRCYGDAKRGQKREWWKTAGKMRRALRTIRTEHGATKGQTVKRLKRFSATKNKRKKP